MNDSISTNMTSEAKESAAEYLARMADVRWQRFLERPEVAGGEGPKGELAKLPEMRPEWVRVWGTSEFVGDQCIRNPGMLEELLSSGALDRVGSAEETRDYVLAAAQDSPDENALHKALRQCRMREMVRIAWRDLSGFSDLDETMACVSALADVAISQAMAHHERWLNKRFGIPTDSDGETSHMVILGLGKLGGRELNYSSDVDLIYAYRAGGVTRVEQGQREIDNHEFFLKLGRKIVAALEPVTADGFVFRTDLRLRPNGDSGPLVLSFAAMEHYYQTHGRMWERYALIKARVVAGDPDSGDELLATLKPFVYRKYLDFGAFDAIREMKQLITQEMKHQHTLDNVKLGWGGIREVEFLVQCHQLIRGGREKRLQTGSLYQAMKGLVELNVMEQEEMEKLRSSYQFLRNTEHRLQMFADRQTQLLPHGDEDRLRLAASMGYEDWLAFDLEIDERRTHIHDRFQTMMAETKTGDDEDAHWRATVAIIKSELPDEAVLIALERSGFKGASKVPGQIRGFLNGRLYRSYSDMERDNVDRLLPVVLRLVSTHADASRSVAGFIEIVEAIRHRTVYISLLVENRVALSQLLRLCAASQWLTRHIGQNPVVLDELLHPIVDISQRTQADLKAELDARMAQMEDEDEEAKMTALREFSQSQVLRIAAADVAGTINADDVHGALAQLAETLLEEVLRDAIVFTEKKLGKAPADAGIIAYGKFASQELGYHSDLDMVVCFHTEAADEGNHAEREYFYSRAGRRFVHLLTTRTSAGILYEIDMRLRPGGNKGTLVASLDGFFEYQRTNAWVWEHQALVRARVVVGSESFRQAFETQRRQILAMPRDQAELKSEVVGMRMKMISANCKSTDELYDLKLDEGGIVDIEFIVQYWVLVLCADHPELAEPRNNIAILEALGRLGAVSEADTVGLVEAYRAYLRRSLDLKLQDRAVMVQQDDMLEHRLFVRALWTQIFGD